MLRSTIILFAAVLIMASCSGNAGADKNNEPDPVQSPAATAKEEAIPSAQQDSPPFTPEDAETVVARHYSSLNGQAKYPLYKGLLVKIDSLYPAVSDTFQFSATIHGRKWLTPNGDTTTRSFRETKTFRASWQNNQWQGILMDSGRDK